jgi:CheY-like chemotaxis protein
VLDISMPLLDGIQLLGLIHQRYPNIKKVVLTGESDDRHRAACLANGAELFLLKPGDEDGWRLIFNLLTSLLRWEDSDDFVSTLSENGLYNIIQLECVGGSSSLLEVRNRKPPARFTLKVAPSFMPRPENWSEKRPSTNCCP